MKKFNSEDDERVINEKDIKVLMLRKERNLGAEEVIIYINQWFMTSDSMDKSDWEAIKLVLTRSKKKVFLEIE